LLRNNSEQKYQILCEASHDIVFALNTVKLTMTEDAEGSTLLIAYSVKKQLSVSPTDPYNISPDILLTNFKASVKVL
jgi:hypothetical protein